MDTERIQKALLGGPYEAQGDPEAFLENFDRLAAEKVSVQNTLVRSGMFSFANALRELILREEETWRAGALNFKVQDFGLPEHPEPILFMSVSAVFHNLRILQALWGGDASGHIGALRWLLRRIALIITFPYDEATFDVPHYRQAHGGAFLANMALLHDAFAIAGTMWRDASRGIPRGPHRLALAETKILKLRKTIMNRAQGDSLATQFQMIVTAAGVRAGDRLVYERRHPAAQPTDMEIITECQGVGRARAVHAASDVRISDVYDDPEYRDMAWLAIVDYFFVQKIRFRWKDHCVTRMCSGLPAIQQIPVSGGWAVGGEPCPSLLQAILLWAHLMPAEAWVCGRKYSFTPVLSQLV